MKKLIRSVLLRFNLMSDPILRWSLVIGTVFVLNGLSWGWAESWDQDQVALRPLLAPDRLLLEPVDFVKAPFHTYLNFFLSVLPIKALEKITEVASGAALNFDVAVLWWSRLIHLGLFLGIITLAYRIVLKASGRSAARIVGLVIGTSAGFVLRAHYLTEDIPVAFWMLASFLAAQRIVVTGRTRNYILAGVLAGMAAATKYNGLAVGLAIPIFHYFAASRALPLKKVAADARLIVGAVSVVFGFVAANPYSLLDFTRFSADAVYGFETLSFYHTEVGEPSFATLPFRIVEILGWPMALIAVAAAAASPAFVKRSVPVEMATAAAAFGIFASYAVIPVRFLLPAVPFLLITGGAFAAWVASSVWPRRHAATAVLALVLTYNVIASAQVGHTFASDPRLAAQSWVASHVPPGAVIEATPFSPLWNASLDFDVKDVRMPFVTGRNRLFSRIYAEKTDVTTTLDQRETEVNVGWYSAAALESRRPDYICIDWLYYGRFFAEPVGPLYPEVGAYFRKLLSGQLGYEVVFDQSLPPEPDWLYPHDIGFVEKRTVILKRSERQRNFSR